MRKILWVLVAVMACAGTQSMAGAPTPRKNDITIVGGIDTNRSFCTAREGETAQVVLHTTASSYEPCASTTKVVVDNNTGGKNYKGTAGGADVFVLKSAGDDSAETSKRGSKTVVHKGSHTTTKKQSYIEYDCISGSRTAALTVSAGMVDEDVKLSAPVNHAQSVAYTAKTNMAKNMVGGGAAADSITTSGGADEIDGAAGGDTITAGDGDDEVVGGAGADTLNGGNGADELYGGTENDIINGGDGDDFIDSGAGTDTLDGSTGNDSYFIESTSDSITDSGGVDSIYWRGTGAVTYTLPTGIENFEDIDFSDYPAINITGNASNNNIFGGSTNTTCTVSGADGDDTLMCTGTISGGASTLNGGNGNDALVGGGDGASAYGVLSADTLDGGAGSDTAVYGSFTKAQCSSTSSTVTCNGVTDSITSIESLQFSDQTCTVGVNC